MKSIYTGCRAAYHGPLGRILSRFFGRSVWSYVASGLSSRSALVCFSLRCMRYSWNAPRKPMPRAMGIGSHLTLVFFSAEFSLDLNDSFLWKFCLSHVARDEVNVRDGAESRAWRHVGGGKSARWGARMSWRACMEAMAMATALATMLRCNGCGETCGRRNGSSDI